MKRTNRITVVVLCALVALAAFFTRSRESHADERATSPAATSQAAKNFERAKKELLAQYVDEKISEEDLYRYALKGMLAGLNPEVHGEKREWNRLFTPDEYRELASDLSGNVVGVGVEIRFVDGSAIITSVIPGTPADKAGIKAGDRILKVGGKSFQTKKFWDLVSAIRGEKGSHVSLTVLQGDRVMTKSLRRESLPWSTVDRTDLPNGMQLIAIHEFNDQTPKWLKKELEKAREKSPRALVVDLRGNQGGVLERMIESASLLLPDGSPVATAIHRGGKQERLVTHGQPLVTGIPIAVLVDKETACGAEMMAQALKQSASAVLVGEHTLGKWSSQLMEEFPDHSAMKYTVAYFRAPSGEAYDGVGLEPDVRVNLDPEKKLDFVRRMPEMEKRMEEDAPLRAAVGILKMKLG